MIFRRRFRFRRQLGPKRWRIGQRIWRTFWWRRKEDIEYLGTVRNYRWLFRDNISWDADIQAFFNNVLQAFHTVLNEISSTLKLQLHELFPPLPCLVKLHMNRSCVLMRGVYKKPTTILFPQLSSLYIPGDKPRRLSFSDELAIISPNLASLRSPMSHLQWATSSSSNVVSNVTQFSALNLAIPKTHYTISTSTKVVYLSTPVTARKPHFSREKMAQESVWGVQICGRTLPRWCV